MERHIINSEGTYIVQVFGDATVTPLPEGCIEVEPKPEPWYDYVDGVWAENQQTKDEIISKEVRGERDYKLLKEVDPVASNTLRWNGLSASEQQEVADYRQALLDVPQQDGFPHSVVWPTKPSFL